MKNITLTKKIIILSILIVCSIRMTAQWSMPGTHAYTPYRVDIGQDLRNGDRQVNIFGAKTYGCQLGIYAVSDLTSAQSFKGMATAKIADCSSYYANGGGVGITAYLNPLTQLKNTSSIKTSLAGGGYFSTTLTDPIPSAYKSIGTYLIFGARVVLNGEISNYPTNGIVTGLLAQDLIKGPKTYAGYFEGNVSIDGELRAEEVTIIEDVTWPDFVFNKNYQLKPLNELEEFILKNNHLPEIPTAERITEEGMNLSEINSKLLLKIEELTLYIIEQNKRIEEQDSRLKELGNAIKQ